MIADSITLNPDFELSLVKLDDYDGFVFPCMVSDTIITQDEIEFVRRVGERNKIIAAQVGAVQILARAGALKGKKFAFADEPDENPSMFSEFNDAIFSGNGVIQDGNIITSGTCPWMAKMTGNKDGTSEVIRMFLSSMERQ